MFGGFSGRGLDKKSVRPWLVIFLALFIGIVVAYLIYTTK